MKEVHYSTKAKKDLKRYRNNPQKIAALHHILQYLVEGKRVPAQYSPHKLTGQYAGCLECHIENDFLLIWEDETTHIIEVVRLGTHSELFSK